MSSSTAFRESFLRLPPATAVLVFAAILGASNGHALLLARETKTAAYHELNVVAWPPLPTEAPISPFELLRRQDENTVCGYIGGNAALPATCSVGSHCVLDSDSGFVGCCPNGGACTTGVFTGCVDYNSGPQTEANPYVYTCQGSDVCYKNEFAGGFFQYGCGTASNLATTVQTSVSGVSLYLTATSVALTDSATSLSTPISIDPNTGTRSFTRSRSTSATSSKPSSSTLSSRTSSSTSTSTSTATTSSSSSITNTASSTSTSSSSSASSTAAPASGPSFDRTGAIVGGTISGVAILAALIALLIFFLRKRRNQRQGPGPTPNAAPTSEYISPMRSHGAAFAPLPTWQEEEEPVTPQPRYNQPYNQGDYQQYSQAYNQPYYGTHEPETGTTTHISAGPEVAAPLRYNPVHTAGSGRGSTPIADAHMSPTGREIDEYAQSYGSATAHARGDEDRQPLTVVNSDVPGDFGSSSGSESGSPSRGGSRPLWQQNRRPSRNLTWM